MSSFTPALYTKVFIQDVLMSVLYFPVWWYTEGLFSFMRWIWRQLSYQAAGYALGVWVRNFFVPMYGQHDWTGRLMSVFMRFVVLIGRLIALSVMTCVYGVMLLAWIFWPVLCIVALLMNVARLLAA